MPILYEPADIMDSHEPTIHSHSVDFKLYETRQSEFQLS